MRKPLHKLSSYKEVESLKAKHCACLNEMLPTKVHILKYIETVTSASLESAVCHLIMRNTEDVLVTGSPVTNTTESKHYSQ